MDERDSMANKLAVADHLRTTEQIEALFAPTSFAENVARYGSPPVNIRALDCSAIARRVVGNVTPTVVCEIVRGRGRWKRFAHATNPDCHYCGNETGIGAGYGDLEATVDHVRPLARGGKDDPSNYVLACRLCNGAKADGKFTPDKRRRLLVKKIRARL